MSQQNIVILGASYSGLYTAHHVLQKVLPELSKKTSTSFHVYLVDQNDKLYHRVPAPRAIASSDLMSHDKLFYSFTELTSRYSSSQLSFVHATVTGLDLPGRTVALKMPSGESSDLPYHALVIATGVNFDTPYWYIESTPSNTRTALATLESSLTTAKTVLIAGGGPAGVETAGEIGEHLNGTPGWFQSRPANQKARITLYSGSDRLLSVLRPAIAAKAERFLARLGVDVVHNIRITSSAPVTEGGRSRTRVNFDNGESVTVDVYISATGSTPATGWAPPTLLSSRGRITNDPKTLRVDTPEAGPRVYAIGDVGTHSVGGLLNVLKAVPVLGANIKRDLLAGAGGEKGGQTAVSGSDAEFKAPPLESQIVPVGRSKGVGAVFGWKLPSWFVWFIKGRDYMLSMTVPQLNGDKVL